jgi:hypothetical protein
MTLQRESFPAIFAVYASRQASLDCFDEMLQIINIALDQGRIRNADLNVVKRRAADFADATMQHMVREPFFNAGRYENQPAEVLEADRKMFISGIHSLVSLKKRIDDIKADNECVRAMKTWVNEYLPLAEAVETLKTMVFKGRAPIEPSEAATRHVNPNKDVKTCPCCMRAIAVVSGKMAHHGYSREEGYQTQSCPGIKFKPMEVSPAGLVFMSDLNKNSIANAKIMVAEAPAILSLKRRVGSKTLEIPRADPRFPGVMDEHLRNLERSIRAF